MNELMIIKNLIYEIRGQKVMIDRDLAELYGVETKKLYVGWNFCCNLYLWLYN